eukprot:COSAG02_NODE_1013_length_15207_cov_4.700556_5_plen_61_part_00
MAAAAHQQQHDDLPGQLVSAGEGFCHRRLFGIGQLPGHALSTERSECHAQDLLQAVQQSE